MNELQKMASMLKELLICFYNDKGLLNEDIKQLIKTEYRLEVINSWAELTLKDNLSREDVELFANNIKNFRN